MTLRPGRKGLGAIALIGLLCVGGALGIPGVASPLDARLEPSGMYLSWNQMHTGRPGRLAFVPLRVIRARL
jgi:hypothetical protein